MILFFGTRQGKAVVKKLSDVTCPFCQQINTLSISEVCNYFHLFWIKLFKISTHKSIECAHCKRVYYEDEFTPEMQLGIQE